jgi:hypothetical protein
VQWDGPAQAVWVQKTLVAVFRIPYGEPLATKTLRDLRDGVVIYAISLKDRALTGIVLPTHTQNTPLGQTTPCAASATVSG